MKEASRVRRCNFISLVDVKILQQMCDNCFHVSKTMLYKIYSAKA